MPDVPQQEEVDVSMEIKAQNKIVCLATSEPQVFDFSKFKTMNQCIRHVAFVKRFFNNCRVPAAARKTGHFSSDEYKAAITSLWQILQLQHFGDEVRLLLEGKPVPRTSRIHNLQPFLDTTGTIRKLIE